MRVLVANHQLNTVGGTESFTWAMAYELVRRGHDVDVFDAQGEVWRRKAGAYGEYDAAFISHKTSACWLFVARPMVDPRRTVQTIHGRHALEAPYVLHPIRHVVVSRELRERYPDYPVVTNAVDLERFAPAPEKSGVLSLCQSVEMNAMLEGVCTSLGVAFSYRDKRVNPTTDIAAEMNAAAVVIGLGRSVVEAMAAGCAVVVADARAYQGAWSDGVLTAENYPALARYNFSGRARRGGVNVPALRESIKTALTQPCLGADMRELAEERHDIRRAVDAYLDLLDSHEGKE